MTVTGDFNLEQLLEYKPELTRKGDFDGFWEETMEEARIYPLNSALKPCDYPIKEIRLYDAYYDGFKGTRINGWFIVPCGAGRGEKIPVLIHYHGYTWNKGYVQEYLKWLIQGYAVFSVSIRGQGGITPDTTAYSQGSIKGWMTLGILNKYEYYYRNVYMDCVRAIDFVCEREEVDSGRIGIYGESQGGGLALAVAALDRRPVFCMPVFPYLCHFERAMDIHQEGPYGELSGYFRMLDPEMKGREQVFGTLSYFDCMNMAPRISCPLLMAIGLKDIVCPPSTMFAAYNHLACEKELRIYPQHGHENLPFHEERMIEFTRMRFEQI